MRRPRSFGLAALLLLLASACADKTIQFTDAGTDESDAMLSPVDAGVDAAIGTPGRATISGAVKSRSPNYKLYGTLRSGDGSSASPNYQRRGGVTGATQP